MGGAAVLFFFLSRKKGGLSFLSSPFMNWFYAGVEMKIPTNRTK